MPATTGTSRPTKRNRRRTSYPQQRRTRRTSVAPPKPDVTLHGDRTTKGRTGHTRASHPTPQRQGHPSQGSPTVGGGTKKHPKTGVYVRAQDKKGKPKVHIVPLKKYRRTQRTAIRRYLARKSEEKRIGGFQKTGGKIDTDTHIGPFNVEAELEGRGALAKLNKSIHKTLEKQQGRGGNYQIGGSTTGKEISDLTANAPSGLYLAGKAIAEASPVNPNLTLKKSDTGELKKQLKSFDETSALAEAGRAVVGKGSLKEALHRFGERPVTTGLEVSGVYGAAGRVVGTAERAGAFGKTAKEGAKDRTREPIHLYPEGLGAEGPKIGRDYSKNAFTRRAQRRKDRKTSERGARPGDVATSEIAGVSVPSTKAVHPIGEARPAAAMDVRLKRRVATEEAAGQRVKKGRSQKAVRTIGRLAPGGLTSRYPGARRWLMRRKDGKRALPSDSPLVHLVAEGTVLSREGLRDALTRRLAVLEQSLAHLERSRPDEVVRNRFEAQEIMKILEMDDAQLDRAFGSGVEAGADLQSRHARAEATGIRASSEARWQPVFENHMGGRYRSKAQKSPAQKAYEGLKAAQREAKKKVDKLRRLTETSRRHEAKAEGRGEVQAQHGARPIRTTVRRAEERVAKAEAALERAKTARGRASAKRRVDAAKANLERITAPSRRKDITRRQGDRLQKVQARRQELERQLAAAEKEHAAATKAAKDAKPKKKERTTPPGWYTEDGKRLTAADAEAFVRAQGRDPATVAFVTQSSPKLSPEGEAADMFMSTQRHGGATPPVFTGKRQGKRYETGRGELGTDPLVRQAVISENEATVGELFQRRAGEYGVPTAEGGGFAGTRAAAERYIDDLIRDEHGRLKPGMPHMTVFNLDGLGAFGDQLRIINDNVDARMVKASEAQDQAGAALADAMGEALVERPGRWAAMPTSVWKEFVAHTNVRNNNAFTRATRLFKDVVLTTASPTSWLTGNISDLGFRTIMEGITLPDVIRGSKLAHNLVERGLDGEMVVANLTGGGIFHTGSLSDRFNPAQARETAARTIGAAPWRGYKGFIYWAENHFEEIPALGRMGKAVRKEGRPADVQMTGSLKNLLRMTDEQIDHFASRIVTDRALETKIQVQVEDVMGRWGDLSPEMRQAITAMPFVQWLGASVRYVLVTLPAKHPIKTGIFAAVMQMTEEERARLGLSYLIPQAKQVEDWQMGSLPVSVFKKDGKLQFSGPRLQNLTSFGTVGQMPQNLQGFLLPQLRGVFGAFSSQAWTGEQMVYPDWWPVVSQRGLKLDGDDRMKVAVGGLLEVGIPFGGLFRKAVQEKGKGGESMSTILTPTIRRQWDKDTRTFQEGEGTAFGAILKWIDPLTNVKKLTKGDLRTIKDVQAAGRLRAGETRKTHNRIRHLYGPAAVKAYQARTDAIRASREYTEAHPHVNSDNMTPEYYELYIRVRRTNQRLADLTGGKEGHAYKKPPKPRPGSGGGNPFGDATQGGAPEDENPFGDAGASPSSGGDENPF